MERLLKEVEKIAKEKYNSQFTILSWENDFKGAYGILTQNDTMENYIFTYWLPSHKTMLELLYHMIHNAEAYVYNEKNMKLAYKKFDLEMGVVYYEASIERLMEDEVTRLIENEDKTTFGHGTCPNCNKEFKRNSHNHKYCSELCRLEQYEKRTGKDISYLKKLHKKK